MPEEINSSQNLDLKPKNSFNNFDNNIDNNIEIKTQKEKIEEPIKDNTVDNIDNIEHKTIETTEDNSAKTNSSTVLPPDSKTTIPVAENNKDKELEEQIDKIIMSDGVSDLYKLMSDDEKKAFEEKKKESSLKIIIALKSANKNIKKAINKIFKIIHDFIKSLKKIDNKAYIEKISKLKVDRIIRENENNKV